MNLNLLIDDEDDPDPTPSLPQNDPASPDLLSHQWTYAFTSLCRRIQRDLHPSPASLISHDPSSSSASSTSTAPHATDPPSSSSLAPWGWISARLLDVFEAYDSSLSYASLLQQLQCQWDEASSSRLSTRVSLARVYHSQQLSKAAVLDLRLRELLPLDSPHFQDFPIYHLRLSEPSKRREKQADEPPHHIWISTVPKLARLIVALSDPTYLSTSTLSALSFPIDSSDSSQSSTSSSSSSSSSSFTFTFAPGSRLRLTGTQLRPGWLASSGELSLLPSPFLAIVVPSFSHLHHRQQSLAATHSSSLFPPSLPCQNPEHTPAWSFIVGRVLALYDHHALAFDPCMPRFHCAEMVEPFDSSRRFHLLFIGDASAAAAGLFQAGDILAIENPAWTSAASLPSLPFPTTHAAAFLEYDAQTTLLWVLPRCDDDSLKFYQMFLRSASSSSQQQSTTTHSNPIHSNLIPNNSNPIHSNSNPIHSNQTSSNMSSHTTISTQMTSTTQTTSFLSQETIHASPSSSPFPSSQLSSPTKLQDIHSTGAIVDCSRLTAPLSIDQIFHPMINISLLARVVQTPGNRPVARSNLSLSTSSTTTTNNNNNNSTASSPVRFKLILSTPYHLFPPPPSSSPPSSSVPKPSLLSLTVSGELAWTCASLRPGQLVFLEGVSSLPLPRQTSSSSLSSASPPLIPAILSSSRTSSLRALDSLRGFLFWMAPSLSPLHPSFLAQSATSDFASQALAFPVRVLALQPARALPSLVLPFHRACQRLIEQTASPNCAHCRLQVPKREIALLFDVVLTLTLETRAIHDADAEESKENQVHFLTRASSDPISIDATFAAAVMPAPSLVVFPVSPQALLPMPLASQLARLSELVVGRELICLFIRDVSTHSFVIASAAYR